MFSLAFPLAPAAIVVPRRSPSVAVAAGAFWRRTLTAVTVAALLSMPFGLVRADGLVPELRLATSYLGTSDVTTYTAAWYGRAPRWTLANRLEYSLGAIDDSQSLRAFAFVGPVWRFAGKDAPLFVDVSLGPTVLAGSTVVAGRELGGRFHFRSAVALGARFGARRDMELAIRVSHISNGGIRDANPGLDSIGLSFDRGFGAR